jgi:heat shock protein HtpX
MPAERNPASAHLFIVNPLSGARMDNLFSTHPNVEYRIARLNEIAREMGQSSPGRGAGPLPEAAEAAGPWTQPQRRVAGRGPWG